MRGRSRGRFPRLPAPVSARVQSCARRRGDRALPLARPAAPNIRRSSCCTVSKDRARRTTCVASPTRRGPPGWNVVRLNQRNCGGTEQLSRGLYHSGLTHDPLFVVRELIEQDGLPAIAIAGYSLGGNLTLKLAGELGDAAPPELQGGVRRVADDGPGSVRRCAGAPLEPGVRVQFRAEPEGAHAAQGGSPPRPVLARPAAPRLDRAAVRRGLHRAASRVPECGGLLLSGQRPARDRSHPRAGAHHDGRERPVRAESTRSAIPRSRTIRTSPWWSRRTAATVRSWSTATATTTATGRSARSSGSSPRTRHRPYR